jgi:tryptophan halogenase
VIKKIVVCGGGTAGLISALMIRQAFPNVEIDLVYSSDLGIVGVGEGSTEHWRIFMDICNIPLAEMLTETKATHKYGIKFINWTNHTPEYFHSIQGGDRLQLFDTFLTYNALNEKSMLLTDYTASLGLFTGKVRADNPHISTNQFHFDTFLLNKYFHKLCGQRRINQIDAKILKVNTNSEQGHINSITLDNDFLVFGDIFIDATGFKRILMSSIENTEWNSYSDILPINKAIPFPTSSREDGIINTYTKATALSSGWVWEIPTQERRGNGYAFSDAYITEEDAVKEFSNLLGCKIESPRIINFSAGSLRKQWYKNVISVGLASSFVEPLEATSIGSTIQQVRSAVQNLVGYQINNKKMADYHNSKMNIMMENLVSMVRLHYMSDRKDSDFWNDQKNWKIPDYLKNLIDIWNERPPVLGDICANNFELFHAPHFWHVAQGQGLLKKQNSSNVLELFGRRELTSSIIDDLIIEQSNHGMIGHAEALKALYK